EELRRAVRVGELVASQKLLSAGRRAEAESACVGVATFRVGMPDVDLRSGQRRAICPGEPREPKFESKRDAGSAFTGLRVGPDVRAVQPFVDEKRTFGLPWTDDARGERSAGLRTGALRAAEERSARDAHERNEPAPGETMLEDRKSVV